MGIIWSVRLVVRTPGFQPGKKGSIPLQTTMEKREEVNHPSRYNQYSVETIEMMRGIWGDEAVKLFCEMTAFKYRMRLGHKDNLEQDMAKEQWYLNYMKKL